MPKPKSKSIRGMGIIADPYRGPAKKRGGQRPARPGWGQALLGRSRRGWSHGGSLHGYPGGIAGMKKTVAEIEGMSPAWTGTPAGKMVRGIAKTIRKQAPGKTRKKTPGDWSHGGTAKYSNEFLAGQGVDPAMYRAANRKLKKHVSPGRAQASIKRTTPTSRKGGGWSLGGALNSKRKGYQSGRTVNPRAAGEEAMKRQRRMQWNARTTAGGPAGWGAYGSPFSSNARFPSPPGGWNRGGPAKFRDDQSLGIRGGVVRKPVGYQAGGTSGYSDAYLQGQGVDPAMYRKANRKLMKQKRQNILSGKSVRTPAPKRKRISTKKGGGGWNTGGILAPHPAGGKMRISKAKKQKQQILKRIKRVPSKRSKAKQKYLSKGRGG